MKRLLLILALAMLFTSFAPAWAQDGNVLPVTDCLNLDGYTGYAVRAPYLGEPPYMIRNGQAYQQLGEYLVDYVPDETLPDLQGRNAWFGYGNVTWLNSWPVAILVLDDRTDRDYLEIRRDDENWFAFPYESLAWFAVVNGERVTDVNYLASLAAAYPHEWPGYRWGVHPCGAFFINPADLPGGIQAFIEQ